MNPTTVKNKLDDMAYVSVDIDIDEVLSEILNSRELQEIVDNPYDPYGPYDDGWVPTQLQALTDSASISDEEWNEVIEKLRTGKIFLTIEEEELIKQLAKKL